MLVLSRKTKEGICIGPNIHITVLAVHGGKVRIGIEAPRDIRINRAEVHSWSLAHEGDIPIPADSNLERIA